VSNEVLKTLFAQYGNIIQILPFKQSKPGRSSALIRYDNDFSAANAITALNDKHVFANSKFTLLVKPFDSADERNKKRLYNKLHHGLQGQMKYLGNITPPSMSLPNIELKSSTPLRVYGPPGANLYVKVCIIILEFILLGCPF